MQVALVEPFGGVAVDADDDVDAGGPELLKSTAVDVRRGIFD